MGSVSSSSIRVRFAPSPTGYLHIGSFRTALFNWLFARHNNGLFLVRIEDTDRERFSSEYVENIMEALRWVDLQPDEPVVMQSDRLLEHERVLTMLLHEKKAYKCYCSQEDIVQRAGDNAFISYDGLCRSADQNRSEPYVIRFKLPTNRTEISFDDLIRGRVTFPIDQLDDFIIARSDGRPTYNFVVVVDDAAMKITQVIRGEDHISNTPKQILLYEACSYKIPQFAHIPLILGPSGDRLSKRDGATSALAYKDMGYLPDALVNYLVRLGWSHGNQELFTRKELIELFTLSGVGKKSAIFDIDKLNWINSVYIREQSASELLTYIRAELDADFVSSLSKWHTINIEQAIDLYKERVHTLRELMHDVHLLYAGPESYQQADLDKWVGSQTKNYLDRLIEVLETHSDASMGELKQAIKELAHTLDIKLVTLAQPMRIALIGSSAGPGVFDMLPIVGTSQAIARLSRLRDALP